MQLNKSKKGIQIFAQPLGHKMTVERDVVGTLCELDKNDYLKFEKLESNGKIYWIPASWVESVEEDGIHLNKTIDEVKGGMMDSRPVA